MEKIIVGVDVGIRNVFSFDIGCGKQYKVSTSDKYLYLSSQYELERNQKLDFWLNIQFGDIGKYVFAVEDCLIDGIKTKRKIREVTFEKNVNKLIYYFLERYKDQIIYVNSKDSSVECSKCGLISHYNRVNIKGFRYNKDFSCIRPSCKFTCDSDINACKVLTKRGNKMIEEMKNGNN